MQHISELLEEYRTPFKELLTKYNAILEKDVKNMTAWERSTYREIIKYAKKEQI